MLISKGKTATGMTWIFLLRVDKTATAIHKVNGKENYTWNHNKKKDLWEKKALIIEKEYPEAAKKEHPGNP